MLLLWILSVEAVGSLGCDCCISLLLLSCVRLTGDESDDFGSAVLVEVGFGGLGSLGLCLVAAAVPAFFLALGETISPSKFRLGCLAYSSCRGIQYPAGY